MSNHQDDSSPIDESAQRPLSQDISAVQDSTPARQPKAARPRGRQPKDPDAITHIFTVASTDDLEATVRAYLAPGNPAFTDPSHTTLEFHIPPTTAFAIPNRDLESDFYPQKKSRSGDISDLLHRTALTIGDTLIPTTNPRAADIVRKQKAIAKALVASVLKADGNRYSFHNSWHSAADNAARFSYFCNDSTLNKGRAANEGAASVRAGKVGRKPVYECKGLVGIKFTRTGTVKLKAEANMPPDEVLGGVILEYRHVQCHGTYEERAPVPRHGSKRRRLMELLEPGKVEELKRGKGESERRDKRRKASKEKSQSVDKLHVDDGVAIGQGDDTPGVGLGSPDSDVTSDAEAAAPEVPTIHGHDNDIQKETGTGTGRDDGLQPLIDFLGNAAVAETDGGHFPIPETLKDAPPPKRPRAKKATSGTKTSKQHDGTSAHDSITDLSPSSPGKSRKQRRRKSGDELDILRRELQEAKDRIQRLEAEKAHAPSPYHAPPPYPPYPYAYPPSAPGPHGQTPPHPHHYPYPYPYPLPYAAPPPHAPWPYGLPPPAPFQHAPPHPPAQPAPNNQDQARYTRPHRPGQSTFKVTTPPPPPSAMPGPGIIRSRSFGGSRASAASDLAEAGMSNSTQPQNRPSQPQPQREAVEVHDHVLDDNDDEEPQTQSVERAAIAGAMSVPSILDGGDGDGEEAARRRAEAASIPSKFV